MSAIRSRVKRRGSTPSLARSDKLNGMPFITTTLSRVRTAKLLPGLLAVCCSMSAASEPDDRVQFFERTVQPLLQKHCYECHSHQAKSSEGGLVLDSRGGWETGGDSGPAVVPGKPDSSLLLKALSYVDDDLRMPPDGRMTNAEIEVFRQWIEDGAVDPRQTSQPSGQENQQATADLWSLKPVHVDSPSQSIDRFINKRLTEAGLTPNAEADRAALLRRASFDLTGLPPTPEEIDQFLRDEQPDAWMRLINRLLNSPRYGERWGRHWLDLARYGDSNGGDINYAHANAWRYRDYVINAFNSDKPYDDFIREQLAGDLLASDEPGGNRAELLTATGFLMLGPKMLSEVDGEKLLIDIVDEQLDVAGKTFLGMTFGCARCHDHKFDPITTRDYYAMAGIFRSTKVMQILRPRKDVAEWIEVDVTPPDVRQKIDALTTERKKLASELDAFGDQAKVRTGNPSSAGRAVVVSDLPTLRSTTWAARVRIDAKQNLGAVISADYKESGQGHSLGFDRLKNGRVPRVVWNHARATTIITATRPVSLGQWHHLAVTYNADTKRLALYVNGELAAAAEDVASTPFTTIGVGRREAPKEFQLLGDVDDVVVYDTALSREEVVVLDAGQKLAHRPVFRWDFEKVQNDEVVDVTGQHNGRLVGLRAESNIIADGFRGKGLSLRSRDTLSEADQQRVAEVRARMKAIDEVMPDSVNVMAVQADAPVDLPVHIRGNHTNPSKDTISRTTPAVFESSLPAIKVVPQNNGRLKFANWIVHPDNPLTARVMVNRIWQHHFGEGLVRTPSNFGHRGELPSHPRLLDWLAHEFVKSGWSIKHMHRLIMTSSAYRRSSDRHTEAARKDAENRLLARFTVRRLEAEAIRDALLAVSGELRLGSPGNLMKSPNMRRVAMTPTDPAYESLDRGVYLPLIRVRGYEMFSIFDVADNGQHVAMRPQTMVAQQALFLLNNPFVIARARQAATRVMSRNEPDAVNIEWLHRLMFGRSPSPAESKLMHTHLLHLRSGPPAPDTRQRGNPTRKRGTAPNDGTGTESLADASGYPAQRQTESAAWQALAHSLFCSNEFIHIR